MSLTLPHRVVLVERRNFHEEWHIACFLVPLVFADHKDASSVRDQIWTVEHFDEFGSSTGCNSGFCHIGKHVYWVSNRRQIILPFFTILFYFVFEGRPKKWFQVRIYICDRQLDQDIEDIKTFSRFYLKLYQHYMKSFIGSILWFNLNDPSMLIILDEYWGCIDNYA